MFRFLFIDFVRFHKFHFRFTSHRATAVTFFLLLGTVQYSGLYRHIKKCEARAWLYCRSKLNVVILLSKKGMTVLDYGSDSKVYVKYLIIGSGTKCKYIFHIWRTWFTLFIWNEVFLSSEAERVNVMESQKCGLGPRL